MKPLPTAEEYYKSQHEDTYYFSVAYETDMIEFAKLHVHAALEAAAKAKPERDDTTLLLDTSSILNSYPDENIK